MQLSKNILISLVFLTTVLAWCSTTTNNTQETTSSFSQSFLDEYNTTPREYRESEWLNMCMKSNLTYCYQESIISKAREVKNAIVCDELENENIKQQCIDTVSYYGAVESGDPSKCDSISWNSRINCEYAILAEKARDEENVEICKEIGKSESFSWATNQDMSEAYTQSRISCNDYVVNVLAFQKLDIELCKDIINPDSQKQCIAQLEEMLNISWTDNTSQTGAISESTSTGNIIETQEESQ